MNKIILTGLSIILFIACNNAAKTSSNTGSSDSSGKEVSAAPADTSNAAIISFESNTHDFGKVAAGEKVSYSYKFKNTGKSPLIISNALASCGCTVPDYPHTPVAPGAEGAISVVFDSMGKSGVQDKVITISSNAIPPTAQLHLTGEVKQAKN